MSEHVVMVPNGMGCKHCGEEFQLPSGPIRITMLAAIGEAFEKDHRHCKPSEAGRKRYESATKEEWLESWDTGISSLTIYSVLSGRPVLRSGPGVPHDPADFGRCYRLLKVAPGWRERLPEVATRYPEWTGLVAAWDELAALYEQELPSGEAPRLYARLVEIEQAGAGS